jgi:hypothetical protein
MSAALWRQVRTRAAGRCEYCHMPELLDPLPFEVDHIDARQHGGRTVLANLALTCFACNHHKGPNLTGRDPVTRRITRLFHPRRERWEDHFTWNGSTLVGTTSIGRTTVQVLAINLPHRIAHREALMEEGIFEQRRS